MTSAGSGEGRRLLRRAASTSPTVRSQSQADRSARGRRPGWRATAGRVAGKAAGALLEMGFDKVVSASIAGSPGPLAPVPAWDTDIEAYSRYNATDGAKIQAGRSRSPRWHRDGLILTIQRGAAAMTLGTDIFVRSGHWNEWMYVHELVHVAQYNAGKVPFVISYLSSAAKEIAKRVLTGKPIDPLTASPYEEEAYGVQNRFMEWLQAGKPASGS